MLYKAYIRELSTLLHTDTHKHIFKFQHILHKSFAKAQHPTKSGYKHKNVLEHLHPAYIHGTFPLMICDVTVRFLSIGLSKSLGKGKETRQVG